MKIYISSDMEGTVGVSEWANVLEKESSGYKTAADRMTAEVAKVVETAFDMGAADVLVRDAHATASNLDISKLPLKTRIFRGWTGDMYGMMSGVETKKYDAVLMTGYHSPARSNGNPLSHTLHRYIESIKINGEICSEFMINAYFAGYYGVPVTFLSGDKDMCESAKELIPAIRTVYPYEGVGGAILTKTPQAVLNELENEVKIALMPETLAKCHIDMPLSFEVQITYQSHVEAYRNSFYPGAIQVTEKKIRYKSTNYLDVMRFLHFCAD